MEGARGAAGNAAEREPGSATGWVALGDIAVRQGELGDAETMYQRAHERAPDDQWAYAKLIEVRLMQLPPEQRGSPVQIALVDDQLTITRN